jgi:MinD superfamily P-loop ATPase
MSGDVKFAHGRLNVGEPLAPSVIKQVLTRIDSDKFAVIDSAPGTSCVVVEAVRETDYCVLVTEPTPFGLNDLELAVDMLDVLKVPYGVVINRSDIGDERVEDFCRNRDIKVLMRIPHDIRIARAYSRGDLIVNALPEYRNGFRRLYGDIESELERGKIVQ